MRLDYRIAWLLSVFKSSHDTTQPDAHEQGFIIECCHHFGLLNNLLFVMLTKIIFMPRVLLLSQLVGLGLEGLEGIVIFYWIAISLNFFIYG